MKKIIIALSLMIFAVSSCGTAKRTADSAKLSKDELMRVDSLSEIMPSFQGGGLEIFRAWVVSQLSFPQRLIDDYINGLASERSLEGRVIAAFVVEADGTIENVVILQGAHYEFDETVKRILLRSPAWTPGNQEGKAVRVRYILPVDFSLPPTLINELRRQRNMRDSPNSSRR